MGDAGHTGDKTAIVFDPPAGSGPNRVIHCLGRLDKGGLLNVAFGHFHPAPAKISPQGFFQVRLDFHRFAQQIADSFAGQVVLGRTESTRADYQVGAVVGAAERLGQALAIIAHLGNVIKVNAKVRQLLG